MRGCYRPPAHPTDTEARSWLRVSIRSSDSPSQLTPSAAWPRPSNDGALGKDDRLTCDVTDLDARGRPTADMSANIGRAV